MKNPELEKLFGDDQAVTNLERIMDAIPGGFFIYHATGREDIIYVNQAVLRIFGCDTPEEFQALTGNTFRGMVHPDDLESTEAMIARQISESEENLDYVEYRIIRKDGSVRYIMDYGHFLNTKAYGDVFFVFIDDATDKHLKILEEKRKTEVIRGLSRNYRAIYLLDLDLDQILPYCEPALLSPQETEALHQSYSAFVQVYGYQRVLSEDREFFFRETAPEHIQARLKRETSYTVNFRQYGEDGEIETEQLFLTKAEDESCFSSVVMGVRTITSHVRRVEEETRLRVQMEYELDEARHANQAKSAFLFNMSHDLRTPMNAIAGFTALARKHIHHPDALTDCLNKVDLSTEHLLALIDDIMDMSQIESGQLRLNPEPCNLREQLSTVLDMFAAQVETKQLEFTSELQITDENIIADPLNLRRILANIVGNAVKFTPPTGKVHVQLLQTEDQAHGASYQFSVADTGVGISESFLPRMFDAFEREETATKTGYQGSGLGLSIVKSLVDMMGGTISVKSKKGQGSTFTISLTFPRSDAPSLREPRRTEQLPDHHATHTTKDRRILLVEDNILNREITTELLTDAGFQVEAVPDGGDAVEAVKTHLPGYYDMVLMDIQMPVIDGYSATQAIRALDREDAATLPIIALSANAMKEDRVKSMECGMNNHIAKPIDIGYLLDIIDQYLQ